jgi:hypothetical protein
MAGWVVRVYQYHGSGFRSNSPPEALRINLPTLVVYQWRRLDSHIVKHSEKVEKRIAWLRNKDLVARIAEETEEETVGLAGAGCENDLFGIERLAELRIVPADGLTRPETASWLGIVVQSFGICKRGEQSGRVLEAAAGWIGGGKVGDGQTSLLSQPVGAGKFAFFGVPACSLRKAHRFLSSCRLMVDDGARELHRAQ